MAVGLFAGKPAPTLTAFQIWNSVNCGSGLAREKASRHKRISAHPSQNISDFPLKKSAKPF
jgi:hypothetical protein